MRPRSRFSKRRRLSCGLAAAAAPLALVLSGSALAGAPASVKTSANAKLNETVVVSPAGRTLYALSPETTHHLLCREAYCLEIWPPLLLAHGAKLVAAKGVQGKLGLLRRPGGKLQVTLRGKPLYRFAEDHRPGEARGDGLESFGGTWHAVTASAATTPAAGTPTGPATTPTTSTPPAPAPAPTTTTPTAPAPAPSPYGY